MRVVFLGTPEFALKSLKAIYDAGHEIAGVFTQPDRPKNRGHKLTPPPVKVLAEELLLPVFQFEKIREPDAAKALSELCPDICVTAAFGQILSAENLSVPKLGTVNVHASLLPQYRGAAPIEWCIINGEKKTGITTMYTDVGLDTGDIIYKSEVDIDPNDTCATLTEKLSCVGAELIVKTLAAIDLGSAPRTPQDQSKASYYPMLKKQDAKIDFTKSPGEIIDLVRAMNGSIGAFAEYGGERIKVFCAEESQLCGSVGEVLSLDPKAGFIIGCNGGSVRLVRLQMPGGKPLSDSDMLRGRGFDGSVRFE